MVWTDTTRRQYDRKSGRYASDCTDEEWALIDPFLPRGKSTGRPRTTNLYGMPSSTWPAVGASGP